MRERASVRPMADPAATLDSIREARARISAEAHVTPVLTSRTLDQRCGCQLFFKCEIFQRVGAFKFRGAHNAVLRLDSAAAARGVVTHSSGNHAQALALAAKLRGIAAHVVMPSTAPRVKRRAVEGYGARVVECAPTLQSREDTAASVMEETGATLIPPYDHPDVIAGQGTLGLELLEQVPDLDTIVAPLGGGGMISGVCIATKSQRPKLRVIGVEPRGADDAARSKLAGALVRLEAPSSIADGLLAGLGRLTWPIVRDGVDAVHVVDDAAIVAAMRLLWERMKLVVEPSGAVALAAVLAPEFRSTGARRVGVVLSGGNVDLDHLPFSPAQSME